MATMQERLNNIQEYQQALSFMLEHFGRTERLILKALKTFDPFKDFKYVHGCLTLSYVHNSDSCKIFYTKVKTKQNTYLTVPTSVNQLGLTGYITVDRLFEMTKHYPEFLEKLIEKAFEHTITEVEKAVEVLKDSAIDAFL